ncbi:methyltransferase domain-containing protein [Nannocystis sp. SCPEA4]|uniref:methyltransferase domain-containing protein n=1 Tax=Nannocystis sp. SCPEA4 TaxID=2996787 RepID=UPI0022719E42|nr:methyltransferase domain-containing protein [Nannocystis sp. SCPEA4]MCY1062153.1 hypothetical protein [Nannocystis sp. SCPEA4]
MQGPTIAGLVLGGVLGLEGLAALFRFNARSSLFAAAVARAQALGRPLVVVGDPDAGMHTRLARAYGCGDVCVDLGGCPLCPVAIAADITKPLPFADNSVVVFVACVFEYVDNVEAAYAELLRVAGSPDNLFVVNVQPWTLTAHLYPGANWAGQAFAGRIAYAPVPTWRKAVYGLTLVGLAAYCTSPWWWPDSKPPPALTPEAAPSFEVSGAQLVGG